MEISERGASEQAGYQDNTVKGWIFRSENYQIRQKRTGESKWQSLIL